MKIAFIVVLYKTPKKEIERLKDEINNLRFEDYEIYFVDNTKNNRGYAGGVNEGIRQAWNMKHETRSIKQNENILFIVANPDISFKNLKAEDFINVRRKFDIAGFAFKQDNKTYYGGEIDKWKLSGGLKTITSMNRFIEVDFVSGSLMIINHEVVKKIGLFDELYFMYYEDVDYCLRAGKVGFKVGIDTKKFYEHFEISNKMNLQKKEMLAKSHQMFFQKYANIWQKMRIMFTGKFFFNFTSLNFSSFINKLLNFFLFIFLVRYLSPADYGIYVLVWAFIEFFSPFLDFGTTSYGLTYLPQEKKQNLDQLISLRFFLSIFIFFLITPLSLIFFHGQINISLYIFLVSMVVLSNMWSGSYLIVTSLKQKIYKASAVSVIFNILLIISLILTLSIKRRLEGVFIILAITYIIYSLVNLYLVKKEYLTLKIQLNIKSWLPILKKSVFFVLIGFFSGLYFKQDVFLLKYLKSTQIVGIYSAGYKFLEALTLIAGSYSMAVLPILAKLTTNKHHLKMRIKRDLVLLSLFGFLISLLFYFTSSYLLSVFLKAKYQNSLDVARIVIFALPFILGATVCFNTLYVLKKIKIVIGIYLAQILINLILNLIFIPKYSFFASAYITIFCEILNLLVGYYFICKYLKNESSR